MAPQTCLNCNAPLSPGAKFCRACGTPVAQPAYQPQPPVYAPEPTYYQPAVSAAKARKPFLKRPIGILLLLSTALIVCLCLVAGGVLLATYMEWIELDWLTWEDVSAPVEAIEETEVALELSATLPPPTPTLNPEFTPVATPTPIIIPGLGIELPHLSEEEEIEIGAETAAEFEREFELSSDAALIERVNNIAETILPYQPRQTIPFTFKVIASDEINAFALPGGFIYISTGMIDFVESDDELAGVIAHEIAHVALRHGAAQIEALAAVEAVANAVATREPDFATIYEDERAQLALQMFTVIAITGWGRGAELDADEYGAVYMHAAGYDPTALIDLFTRFQDYEDADSGDILNRLLSTHPPFSERIARVEEAIVTHDLS